MPGVIGTESLSGELFVDVDVGVVVGVEPATRVEGVGAADEHFPFSGARQHADVILAVVLRFAFDQTHFTVRRRGVPLHSLRNDERRETNK